MTTDILPVIAPAHIAGPAQGRWTYADYAALADDGQRYEIIDGVLYMAPAPNIDHQRILVRLLRRLAEYLEQAGLGEVLVAPVDVELAPSKVVQPDLLVVLHTGQAILTESRIVGPPDLIVEVASPSTASYDRREKWNAYAEAGVAEYWIVDPSGQTIEVLVLEQGAYQSLNVFRGQALLPSRVLPGLSLTVAQLFA